MLNDLQKCLLKMMKWFHSYCEENHLTYYIIGGTMLGAARHHGFIPWDDDMDIGMPREDYDRLLDTFSDASGSYRLETPYSTDPHYWYYFSKLYDTSTTLIENTNHDLVRGVYIDIFPFDGIGNSAITSRLNYFPIKFGLDFLTIRSLKLDKKRSWFKNYVILFSQSFSNRVFNDKKLSILIDRYCKRHSYTKCNYGGNLLGAWRFREVMPVKIYGSPTLYNFEDTSLFGVEDFDSYLTFLYGEWKKLPPIEKRISHHDYYLDLTTSFDNYFGERN